MIFVTMFIELKKQTNKKKKKIFGVALKYNATLRMSLVDVLGKCLDF